MVGIASDESGVGRPLEGISSGQHRSQSGEALVEWRSSEQLEIGTPSTSPPYWDCDDEDEGGPKPSELYGKYTWKIDKFSQINKRELRSDPFEVGGYKWYILIYPQGCDVCNHLSLFLCVANHDKHLPGWSHFAQFTIAVVNKDPKKSKYSDTLHRFWKKEHDWGWKKFMELSKVLDGFIDADTLIIKAQVQVIRERADRPFRCLDCSYRRELVRVYLTNVEQICRRFVEERRGKLGKLIEDKGRWTSVRRSMSWEKMDLILKVVVKHFFIEKEVTSTLVMDSLYSGMKALEGQSEKSKSKHGDLELPVPIVRVEKDMFVLVDDVLLLLERASLEPLPPKDEKGPQNRTKDGSSGEDFTKDSIERDERRLTELGRRTIEIFVLAHIFSKIEVAYQEAVSLKRQEELIREEEAAWLAECEQKARRGTVDKEKKSKKKQGKQKRNNRKTKDKGKDEKPVMVPAEHDIPNDERINFFTEDPKEVTQKADIEEDVSDVSDSVDCTPKACHPDAGDQNVIAGNWDTDTSDLHAPLEASSSEISSPSAVQDGHGEMSVSAVDDSSSTCSTDSVPSVVVNGFNRGNTSYNKNQRSSNRRQERSKSTVADWSNGYYNQPSEAVSDGGNLSEIPRSCNITDTISKAAFCSTEGQTKWSHQPELKKDEEVAPSRTVRGTKEARAVERLSSERTSTMTSTPASPTKIFSHVELKSGLMISNSGDSVSVGRHLSDSRKQAAESSQALHPGEVSGVSRQGTCKAMIPDTFESRSALPGKPLPQHISVSAGKPSTHQVPVSAGKPSKPQVAEMSRPLSTSLVPGSRPASPVTSMVQTPLIPRSSSIAGRLGLESSTATTHSYASQSYRNVMMGNTVTVSSMGFSQPHSPNSGLKSSPGISQSPALLSKPLFSSQSSERGEANANKANFSFGMVKQDLMPSGQHWIESPQRGDVTNKPCDHLSSNEIRNIDVYKQLHSKSTDLLSSEYAACTSGRVTHGLADEFPHIGIINDLLEDDAIGKATVVDPGFYTNNNGLQHFHRQFSFPGDIGMSNDLGPSSSCRLERTLSYHDGLHHSYYASQGVSYEALRDTMPQPDFRPYANGHINLMPNQWHMTGNERPYLSNREMDNDGYTYHNPAEFLNMACARPTFSGFHPSNGN